MAEQKKKLTKRTSKTKVVKIKTLDSEFAKKTKNKINKKIHSKKRSASVAMEAISLFGLIGFTVGIPVFLFSVLGVWLDDVYPKANISFSILGIITGLFAGIYNATVWVKKENDKIRKIEEKKFNGNGKNNKNGKK